MSPRGVELLFREFLGISPSTFVKNRRLQGVRSVLLHSERKPGLVKESAMQWGFMHMGHFSRSYRQLFYESPSETVAR
jgi:AraC family ethanolamine operon transcriptional activator